MGKRGKRNRSKRKEDSDSVDNLQDKETPKESLSVSLLGDDQEEFSIPASFIISDLYENELLRPIKSFWECLEMRAKNQWNPTIIQLQTWSILFQSKLDMIGIAPTGSGKTYAYGLPMLAECEQHKDGIQGLVLVPTRELARQVERSLSRSMKKSSALRLLALYGGDVTEVDFNFQSKPVLITATPGRLIDVLKNSNDSKWREIPWITLDEADRLAMHVDLANQVDEIFELLGRERERRICLFSATFPVEACK
jgi:superfamily II DNA/RNA helicase